MCAAPKAAVPTNCRQFRWGTGGCKIVTRTKICGITNLEDARAAIDYGADALGFIMVPESPRYVLNRTDLAQLLQSVPPMVASICVCRRAADMPDQYAASFHAIQFYEPGALLSAIRHNILACRMRDEQSVQQIAAMLDSPGATRPDALLLDTYHKDKLGGAGETFNWNLAIEARRRFGLPIILAGGLTPENVGEAIEIVRPFAVDVSSGVEVEPGRKDHAKLRAFLRAVRTAC